MAIVQYKKNKVDWFKTLSEPDQENLIAGGMGCKYIKLIEKNIPKDRGIIIFGAGWGRFVQVLRNHGYKNVQGIEINEGLIELGKNRGIRGIIKGTILSTPFTDGQFDACLDFGTIEHFSLKEQEKIVGEAKRITKPSGLIFIDVPYINVKRVFLYPLMVVKNFMKKKRGYPFYQYIYTKKEARNILKSSGIKVVGEQIRNSGCRIGIMGKKQD